jgi:D-arginine dehydrogenase
MGSYDVLVIGGGMAGVSIGYELAADRSVGLLEMEPTLSFHTTGRSVATFLESYGGRTIRLLTTASRSFMEEPTGLDRSLLTPITVLWVAKQGDGDDVRAMSDAVSEFVPVQILAPDAVQELAPVFQPGWVELGLLEPGGSEVDVAALHDLYATGLRRRGGEIHTSAGVAKMERVGNRWHVADRAGNTYDAAVVVNASGAWADVVAGMARVKPVNIHPLRRTVFMFAAPAGLDTQRLPLVGDVNASFYFKPEGEQILVSPADEVPSEPCDAKPDEIDVAMAIDTINEATTFNVRHVRSSWAGLRSFVADRTPVVGFDDDVEGFFWFVGQGGYGIQIAPALAEAGASLIRTGDLPARLVERGLDAASLGRARLVGLPDLTIH